jgi:tryptophan synthase alpha chain
MANRIDTAFSRGKLFIPYVTAGFPSVEQTDNVLDILVENGADLIELGYPFSDPTADGPVIQESSQQAIRQGFTAADYFGILERFRARHPDVPLIVFSYYNPICRVGVDTFMRTVAAAGADGLLLVDLPFEEQHEASDIIAAHGLHLIQLIAPTTPTERIGRIVANAAGFVYQVSLRGVTGVRVSLADDAAEKVQGTKALTSVPVALGFGISTAEQAASVAAAADAVVVGSAIVRAIADAAPDFAEPLGRLCADLAAATHNS